MLGDLQASGEDPKSFMNRVKNKEDGIRLMGFGHRVYKNYDPRAAIIKKAADEILAKLGKNDPLLDIAKQLEEIALADDYFVDRASTPTSTSTGLIYKAMGFPSKMFTVLFAIGRLPGWIAQWRELMNDPETKIGPRQIYRRGGAPLPGLRPARCSRVSPSRRPHVRPPRVGAAGGGMASYSVNSAAIRHVRSLIDKRRYVLDSEWGEVQPDAAAQNTPQASFVGGARLAPGADRGANEETKRYAFVCGDFSRVHRPGSSRAPGRPSGGTRRLSGRPTSCCRHSTRRPGSPQSDRHRGRCGTIGPLSVAVPGPSPAPDSHRRDTELRGAGDGPLAHRPGQPLVGRSDRQGSL